MMPDLDPTVPVLLFKIGEYAVHHGTLGVVRSFAKLGVPAYACVEDRFNPVLFSRYLKQAFLWDTRHAQALDLVAGLLGIQKSVGTRMVLLATDDAAATFIAENATLLDSAYLFSKLPKDLPARLSNKRDLYLLCKSNDVPCPETVFPQTRDEVLEYARRALFPVVVKTADARNLPAGAPRVSIARTSEQLVAAYRRAENPAAPNIILQEYIPQSHGEDWIFHGYQNPQTNCFIGFTGRKLRSYPPFAGITTLGIPVPNELLTAQTERFARTIGYAGIMDIDYRLDMRDGQYKLLDFNPRIGANFRMFEDQAGLDVARAMHLDLTGRTVHVSPVCKGRLFVVQPYDLLASFGYARKDRLSIARWWQTRRGIKEAIWLDWSDPMPLFGISARLFRSITGRIWAGLWPRTHSTQAQLPPAQLPKVMRQASGKVS